MEVKKIVSPVNAEQNCPRMGISDDEFRKAAKDLVDYITDHYNSLGQRKAYPDVQPGFMREQIPHTAPQNAGSWNELFEDFENVIMQGMTQWQSPTFFAYFPAATNYPSILADMLSSACAGVGFSWNSAPSYTELETVMLDWLAKALNLPKCFWHDGEGPGCGVIQNSASESTLVTLLAARNKTINQRISENPNLTQHEVLPRLVAYSSKYSHSSVERACLIGMVNLRQLPVDNNISVRGHALQDAIDEDKAAGKIPFYVCATLGTTACCTFDNVSEIGEICDAENIWMHIDAAYVGNSFICPEFRHFMDGIELATSYNFNPHKWIMDSFGCSALWVKNLFDLNNSLCVDSSFSLPGQEESAIDYSKWTIPFGRSFRALKLWFVFRLIGVNGLRERVREDVRLAKLFESYVQNDLEFEVVFPVELGLVCMRMLKCKDDPKENCKINETLLKRINNSREIHIIGAEVEGMFFLRVCTGATACDEKAVKNCWSVIKRQATMLLQELG